MYLELQAIGNIGSDATIKHFTSGSAAINFNICVTIKGKNAQGEPEEKNTWVGCTYWKKNDQLRVADFLTKGTRVMVSGFPSVRMWNNASGASGVSLDLRVKELILLGGGTNQGSNTQASTAKPEQLTPNNLSAQPVVMPEETAPAINFNNPGANDDLPF